jgi:hypothetical protein
MLSRSPTTKTTFKLSIERKKKNLDLISQGANTQQSAGSLFFIDRRWLYLVWIQYAV